MDSPIYVVIGHRGTGKTHWVQQVKKFFQKRKNPVLCLDLDKEIEKSSQKSITQWFAEGESSFRKQENKIFLQCFQKAMKFQGMCLIAVGAGYDGNIPDACQVIFLQRPSDQIGRVFLDQKQDGCFSKEGDRSHRPRLYPHQTPFEEYKTIYQKRQTQYQQRKDVSFTRLDYFLPFEKWDEVFLGESPLPFSNGVMTLEEKKLPVLERLPFVIHQKLKWNLKYFELRDDQISSHFLKQIIHQIPIKKLLFSFRKKDSNLFSVQCNHWLQKKEVMMDWPFEWGKCQRYTPPIYSLHTRNQKTSLQKQLNLFSKLKSTHLKLAIPIDSFEELLQCHLWWQEDPKNRSFHPCSKDGRYHWYRLLFGPKQFLYFIRDDKHTGMADQPLMAESVRVGEGVSSYGFVAVMGDPVSHSRTPFFYQKFLEKYSMPVVAIRMTEKEMTKKNLNILETLGLQFVAITSPLKQKAFQIIPNQSPVKAINTVNLKKWKGWNTDIQGAKKWSLVIPKNQRVAIWGGGGTREVLKKVIPDGHFYSARTGKLLHSKITNVHPSVVVWAVGRMPHVCTPPKQWKPTLVMDVNYSEDSPGREYALKTGAKYVSGLSWFQEQAIYQQKHFQSDFTP